MKSQSMYRKSIKSTNIKSVDTVYEYYLAVIETKMLVSICAYNEVTAEVFVTQFLDCTTFNLTSSTILRFAPKALASLETNKTSVFFKQIEAELLGNTTIPYFLPTSVLPPRCDLNQFARIVKSLNQLQLCYSILEYLVNQNLQIHIKNIPIAYYNIQEVLVFNLQTTLSLDVMQLSKLYSPITNGGKRLIKANLLQPFSTIENIQARHLNIETLNNKIPETITILKEHLQRFKTVDTLACQLYNKSSKLQDQLQQICKIYNFQKDVIIFTNFLNEQGLNEVMGLDFNTILMQDEFQEIKKAIEEKIDTNETLNIFDEDTLYFIMINEKANNLKQNRMKFIAARQDINVLFLRYKSSFCLNLKCKKFRQGDHTLRCLKTGYIFELSINEAIRNNINELDIKRLIEKEDDIVIFIDKSNKKYVILTDRLKNLNTILNDCVNGILTETQAQVAKLYEEMQIQCCWILKLNCLISQIDVVLAIRDFQQEQFKNKEQPVYPQFGSSFSLKDGAQLGNHQQRKTLNVSFNPGFFNIVYDQKECLSEQLKLLGQFVILAQIGSPIPCSSFTMKLQNSLYTHFQQYTIQNLAERQSSFTAEVQSLTNLLNQNLDHALILCDSLAISSSHESNVAFSLSFLERISGKVVFGLFGSANSDIMQIADLVECNFLISKQSSIEPVQYMELERILDDEFNLDYKLKFLDKLKSTLEFPGQFLLIFERNFNRQYD